MKLRVVYTQVLRAVVPFFRSVIVSQICQLVSLLMGAKQQRVTWDNTTLWSAAQ